MREALKSASNLVAAQAPPAPHTVPAPSAQAYPQGLGPAVGRAPPPASRPVAAAPYPPLPWIPPVPDTGFVGAGGGEARGPFRPLRRVEECLGAQLGQGVQAGSEERGAAGGGGAGQGRRDRGGGAGEAGQGRRGRGGRATVLSGARILLSPFHPYTLPHFYLLPPPFLLSFLSPQSSSSPTPFLPSSILSFLPLILPSSNSPILTFFLPPSLSSIIDLSYSFPFILSSTLSPTLYLSAFTLLSPLSSLPSSRPLFRPSSLSPLIISSLTSSREPFLRMVECTGVAGKEGCGAVWEEWTRQRGEQKGKEGEQGGEGGGQRGNPISRE
ncbi:unnamed protein product [Closterium sp. NIES-64]|nr:unnamed protein product [Closterium sp. NIES-64]